MPSDPLQVATWLQACHDAGIDIRMQINESDTPEAGMLKGTAPADRTDAWYRHLDAELQSLEISGLTDTIRQSVVMPEKSLRSLPAPARLLHVLREIPEAFPLTAAPHPMATDE